MSILGHPIDLARRGLIESVLVVAWVGGYVVHRIGRWELRKH